MGITVGKRYPGPIPDADAPILEIGPAGELVLLIQLRNPSNTEATALQSGFSQYSIYEHSNGMAVWVFQYPQPLGYMDACFHAGIYEDDRAEKFVANPLNILQVYVLDGEIVTNFTFSFIKHEALQLFQQIVKRQKSPGEITQDDYNNKMAEAYRLTPGQIFQRGIIFTHNSQQ